MYENLTRLDLVGPALARALGDPGWERLEASLVSGGKSNLTFELTSDAGEAVLRRPPDGPLLPRAHDMGREARVQRALAGTGVPVAAILLEDAGDLIGVPFYVMEKVDGYVMRGALPAGWAEAAEARRAVGHVPIGELPGVHHADHAARLPVPRLPGRTLRHAHRRRPVRPVEMGRAGPLQVRGDRPGHRRPGAGRGDGRPGVRQYRRRGRPDRRRRRRAADRK